MKLTLQFNEAEIRGNTKEVIKAMDKGLDDYIDFVADRSTQQLDNGRYQGIGALKRTQEIIYEWLRKILYYHAPYAVFVEYGTGIYSDHPEATKQPIRPKNSKVLAWVTEGVRPAPGDTEGWKQAQKEGRARYAKYVLGMEARPYVRPAIEEGNSRVREFFINRLSKIPRT